MFQRKKSNKTKGERPHFCGTCAQRLEGRKTADLPQLLDGVCPLCGGEVILMVSDGTEKVFEREVRRRAV